jgi:hypothetical protein
MVGTDIVSIKRTVSLGDALAKLSLRCIVVAIAFPAGLLTLHTFGFRLIALDVPEPRIRCQQFIQLIGVDTHLQVMQPFRDLGRVTRLFAMSSIFHSKNPGKKIERKQSIIEDEEVQAFRVTNYVPKADSRQPRLALGFLDPKSARQRGLASPVLQAPI